MTVHLGLDAGSGVILAASPWIFGFAALVYLPHLILGLFEIILGLFEIGAALTTRTVPYVESGPAENTRGCDSDHRSMVNP
jgi:hypothetical protein